MTTTTRDNSETTSRRVLGEDGMGPVYYYPDGGAVGQVKRDYGTFGTIWVNLHDEAGITRWGPREFHAKPGTYAGAWRTFKTLGGAVRYMSRMGHDAYGRDLA